MILANGGEILVAGPGRKIVEGNPGATDNTEGAVVFADEFVVPDS